LIARISRDDREGSEEKNLLLLFFFASFARHLNFQIIDLRLRTKS